MIVKKGTNYVPLQKPGTFDGTCMRVINPDDAPQQENEWDCGFFVVKFVEAFLDKPPKDEVGFRKDGLDSFAYFSSLSVWREKEPRIANLQPKRS